MDERALPDMNFLVTHRHAFLAGLLALGASIFLHDWNAYPSLGLFSVLAISALRLFLLGASFVLGGLLIRFPRRVGIERAMIWIAWLLFLPGTIYSITESRSIEMTCRLTTDCNTQLWTFYPTFIYTFAGVLIFVFTLSQVSAKLILHSARKRIFILAVCLYASVVSVLILFHGALFKADFYINIMVFFLFTTVLFFLLNRILYRAHKYIFG